MKEECGKSVTPSVSIRHFGFGTDAWEQRWVVAGNYQEKRATIIIRRSKVKPESVLHAVGQGPWHKRLGQWLDAESSVRQ